MKLLQLKLNFNGPLPLTFSHSVPAFKKTRHDRCKGRSCNDVRASCVLCSEKQVRPVKAFYEQDAQLLNVKLMGVLCMLTAALKGLIGALERMQCRALGDCTYGTFWRLFRIYLHIEEPSAARRHPNSRLLAPLCSDNPVFTTSVITLIMRRSLIRKRKW